MELPPPAVDLRRLAVGRVGDEWGERSVPEEVAISLTYNRDSHAVMMATPLDLEDFGVGFSLNEGLISRVGELTEIELCRHELGLELRMSLGGEASERSLERRRRIAGPVGCGLCGIESLAEALRPLPRVSGSLVVSPAEVRNMVGALAAAQPLNRRTRAVHAAGFWRPDAGLALVREDVGRHNALDKLAGAIARSGESASRLAIAAAILAAYSCGLSGSGATSRRATNTCRSTASRSAASIAGPAASILTSV